MTFWRRRRTSDERFRDDERDRAKLHNLSLGHATQEDEAARRFEKYRARDPFPDIPPALLNSADILDYVIATGMLHPFDPAKLKSASYEVALVGPFVQVDGDGRIERGDLKRGQKFTLRKNSIAFMTVEPYFRLPDYIALRHNLKIAHVYKGLLVGTGPLIDPGFVGKISLPLHNLTETDYQFKGGEGIIWAEFTKLSPRPEWDGAQQPRRGRYISFASQRSRDKTVDDYVTDAVGLRPVPESSSAAIDARSRDAIRIAKRMQILTTFVSVAGAAVLLGLGLTALQLISDLSQEIADLKVELNEIANQQER